MCSDIDECANNPCLNGATCSDEVNNYTCICAAGYTGTNCSSSMLSNSFIPLVHLSDKQTKTCRKQEIVLTLYDHLLYAVLQDYVLILIPIYFWPPGLVFQSMNMSIYMYQTNDLPTNWFRYWWVCSQSLPKWCNMQRSSKQLHLYLLSWIYWDIL